MGLLTIMLVYLVLGITAAILDIRKFDQDMRQIDLEFNQIST